MRGCCLVTGEFKKKTCANRRASRVSTHAAIRLPWPAVVHNSPIQTHASPRLPLPAIKQMPIACPNSNCKLACTVEGCRAGPFKSKSDLKRHALQHGTGRRHDCTALGCTRVRSKGFTRSDKLTDHMLAGHDEDDMFVCTRCSSNLSRDLFSIHNPASYISHYRTCPMPRCSTKFHTSRIDLRHNRDRLQSHILEKHDLKARTHFANLLRLRGYDARTCEVICPVCPSPSLFANHGDFIEHLMQMHIQGRACRFHLHDKCDWWCVDYRLKDCTWVSDEIRQHRRTILRICPLFTRWNPLWEDIKCQRQD
jgi:hypothetical protein